MNIDRNIVSIKLLGKEQIAKKKKQQDYAIEVMLSDESVYTIYRSKKQIASFNHKLINKFPVEAGYFNDREKIIPDCPFKKTPFGIKQAANDEARITKFLNTYLKELSALPPKMIKCDVVVIFMSLRTSDMQVNDEKKKKKSRIPKRNESLRMRATSQISKPMQLKLYTTVADFSGQKFRFKKDTVVQVVQKDPKGWWLIDVHGELGWAPASFLVLKDEDDASKEEEENRGLIEQDKMGARYISISQYEAKQEDEISFMTGAIVRVIKKYIDGWWLVKYNGQEGFVPGISFRKFDKRQATAYVKNIKRKASKGKSIYIKPTMQVNRYKDGADTAEPYRDVVVYECTSMFTGKQDKYEINLNRGDIVNVLEKKDNGWWYVRDWHGRTGWAPGSYLKDVHEDLKHTIKSQCTVVSSFESENENELSIQKGDIVTVVTASDDGWWRVRRLNDPKMEEGLVPSVCLKDRENTEQMTYKSLVTKPILEELNEIADDVFDDSSAWADSDEDIQDCYVVSTNYTKQYADEIDALEGQIACVVDHTDKDTWYIEIDGKEGWIPSCILRRITDEELNDSKMPKDTPQPPVVDQVTPPLQDSIPRTTFSPRSSTSSTEENHHLSIMLVSSESSSSDDDDDDEEMHEIQKALEEAEKMAREANEKAASLRKKAEEKRKSMNQSVKPVGGNENMKLVERLV